MDMTQLLALQKEDSQIRELEKEIKTILPRRKEEALVRLQTVRGEVEVAQKKVAEAQREYSRFQRDYTHQRENMARAEHNQMNVKSGKAIDAAMQEHASAALAADKAAAAAAAAVEALSPEERELKKLTEMAASEEVAVQDIINGLQARATSVNAELENLKAQREAIAKTVPAAQLAYYERLKLTRWPCIVSYNRADGICAGCNLAQPPSVTQIVRKADMEGDLNHFVTCPTCGRILI